jgi:phosphopantothenoylcysteine synthetase/decarboxylase
LLEKHIRLHYDVVVHAAAVSDYNPKIQFEEIEGDRTKRTLTLIKTPKLIDRIRHETSQCVRDRFKYEPDVHRNVMIARGTTLLKTFQDRRGYREFLVKKRYLRRS